MSTSVAKEGKKMRYTVMQRPSKRGSSLLALSSRRSFTFSGSKILDRMAGPTPRQAARVFDEENNDVTPQPFYRADLGAEPGSRFLVDELSAGSTSDQTTFTGSFTMPFSRSVLGSSRLSSQSTIESVNEEMEETFCRRDFSFSLPESLLPDEKRKKGSVKDQMTQALLKGIKDILITETDTISLLDIPPTLVSVNADDADVIIERNKQYSGVCRNRGNNEKYVERAMQTLNGATKNKQIQNNLMLMVDTATIVSAFDMYAPPEQEVMVYSPEMKQTNDAETVVDSRRSPERSLSLTSSASTVISSCSLKDVETVGSSLNTQVDFELIMTSDKFQYALLLMERTVLRNNFQSQLAAYRKLPLLEDPDRLVKPKEGEQSEAETSCSPALQCLWVFRCELSRGCRVSSMAWNKKNPDLLAVGYGETDYRNHEQGLVCCWSIKNPTWPERIINCDSAVTTVDFSSNSPGQLAVGMSDGSIAIHNVQSADNKSPFISSRECAKRHLGPVWQLRWNQQELSFTGEEKVESLYSVGADGRICKWFVINGGLDCTDLMKLKKMNNTLRKTEQNKPEKTAECVLSVLTPGLCFDFHPSDPNIYLTGTWEGNIHKCSCSNGHQFLETYRKHFCPVNCITWCPLHPDVFLSCSSDSTIQLWKQDCINPLLSFTSNQPVAEVRWSPKHATVFGAVNEEQLEIWDLNSSFLDPVIVQPAAPGLKMTSLLFASLTDCVVVGDSDGQVTAYQLQNLRVGESSQGDVIQGLLHSASPKELQETLM
ncbi:WD repeat-containing protein 78 isoform X1 [Xiphophorus hellerii]|uniref:WD repeat-containing protein 78 isoform X1 n=1 Tax=Xiphophorus hellerii TaxID=8084 RepID=UPI0013B3F841|nr:WD repeat-containing protein 78 isoform X1 [Xiphophorus hellerii]